MRHRRLRRRSSLWMGLIGGALALVLAAVGYVQARQYGLLNLTVQYQDDYFVLSLFQVETEYLRLRTAWQEAATRPGAIDREGLQLRYDIFVSRVGLLRNDRASRVLQGDTSFDDTMNQLRAFIDHADTYLADPPKQPLSPEALLALQAELEVLAQPVHSMSLGASHHVARQITQRYDTVRQHNRVGIALTVLLSAMTLLFALISLRQMRQLDARGRRLERMTARLRAARRQAEAGSRAKSVFLANMSHEIRTPFQGLLGMLSLLRDTRLDPQQLDYLRTAADSADHLLAILNDILDLSKLESGSLTLVPESVALGPLVDEVALPMRPQAAAKGLALRVQREPDLPAWVIADATRVKQVLFNLLSNAIKFSDAGTVTLSVQRGEAGDGRPILRFTVEDNGIGMDEALQARLFQRFVQGDGSRARRHAGTGLGLEISRNLARLMGGDLSVQSVPGQGSRFTLELPLREAEAPPAPEPAAPGGPVRRLSVLVAEDHPVNRKYIAALLDKLGHQASFAENGEQAVQAVQRTPFDLVLMDLHMPGLDGLAATRAVRAMPGSASHVHIVALTADAFAETRERCLAAGMDEFLAKPVQPRALAELLARLFGTAAPTEAMAPAPAAGAPTLLDRRVIDGVLQVMPLPRYTALLDTFLGAGDELGGRLREALRLDQRKELAGLAHSAKGAALNLGLKGVAEVAEQLQLLAANAPAATLAQLIDRFGVLLHSSREECAGLGLMSTA